MATQSGIYHQTYASDMQLRPTTMQRVRLVLVAALLVIIPFVVDSSTQRLVNTVVIAAIGAIGLNVLVGYTGQISLGQGAFLAIGAYSCGLLQAYLNVPWPIALLAAAFISALLGGLIGLPSLRLKGLYLAVATLAAQQIVDWVIINWDPIDGEINGRATDALRIPGNALFGNADLRLNNNDTLFYIVAAAILVVVAIATTNLFRTHIGRAFVAIRDQDIAAEVMGVNLHRYKVLAFMVSSFIVGIAGAAGAAKHGDQLRALLPIGQHRVSRHDYHRRIGHGQRVDLWRHVHRRAARSAAIYRPYADRHRRRLVERVQPRAAVRSGGRFRRGHRRHAHHRAGRHPADLAQHQGLFPAVAIQLLIRGSYRTIAS